MIKDNDQDSDAKTPGHSNQMKIKNQFILPNDKVNSFYESTGENQTEPPPSPPPEQYQHQLQGGGISSHQQQQLHVINVPEQHPTTGVTTRVG
jgi:hypothetical protein